MPREAIVQAEPPEDERQRNEALRPRRLSEVIGQRSVVERLKIVLKSDVQGSSEALRDALNNLSTEQVKVDVISSGVGGITETDVNLAKAGNAIIVGFHVRPAGKAAQLAEQEHVDITCFTAQTAEVEVDTETGQVCIRRIVSAHDVGTIINPLGHQGQIDGGTVMGIGFGTMEELGFENGRVTNANLGEFKLPTIADILQMTTVFVESAEGPAPYQGKAIGESGNVPTAAAIANAVYDAVGVRITDLPITAEKVLSALREREGPSAG